MFPRLREKLESKESEEMKLQQEYEENNEESLCYLNSQTHF